jgi:hypothetical protein
MFYLRTHARGLSMFGVIITVILLFGVSCGSGTTGTTDVGKSVSTTHTISGYAWTDSDSDGLMDQNEPVWEDIWVVITVNYQDEPLYAPYQTYTDSNGYYSFTVNEGAWGGRYYCWPVIGPTSHTWWDLPYMQVSSFENKSYSFHNHPI